MALALTTVVLDPRRTDPWPIVLLVWFAALAVTAWACRPVAARVVLVHAAALCLGLSGLERWLALGPKEPWALWVGMSPELSPYYVRPDAVTGFGPARGVTAHASRRHEGTTVYDVTYRIGADGFRVAPGPVVQLPQGTVVVFGCSFAFGEGVDDEGTLAWRIAERTGRRWEVRNEAFSGWGPQQMLALLESGRGLGGGKSPGRLVLFETLGDHVPRALGRRPWSRGAPRYETGPDGVPKRRGSWGEDETGRPLLVASLAESLERSILFQRVLGDDRRVTSRDLALAASLVTRSRDLVLRADPSARFEVLFWDERDPLSVAWRESLRARGLRVHDASAILRGYPEERRFQLPFDGHPTPLANDLLAAYVVGLLPRGTPGPE